MICKTCKIEKQAGYFTLKQILAKEGVHIEHPVFHSTAYGLAEGILTEGFKAKYGGSQNDAYHDNSVCFTRNLCFSEKDIFGGGQVIFVLDLVKLKNRFHTYSYNWDARHVDPRQKQPPGGHRRDKLKDPERFEFEERVSVSPKYVRDVKEPETVIPPKYIEVIILKDDLSTRKKLALFDKYIGNKVIVLRSGRDQYSLVQSGTDLQTLMDAIDNKNIDAVKHILGKGEKPIGAHLQYAVKYAPIEIIQLLLDHGADPNEETEHWGESILETAVSQAGYTASREPIIKLLIDYGAFVMPALATFIDSDEEDAIELILHNADKSKYDPDKLLMHVCSLKNYSLLKVMVETYNFQPTDTALALSSGKGSLSIVRLLLQNMEYHGGLKLKSSDSEKDALDKSAYWAMRNGHKDVVQLLVTYGADPQVLAHFSEAA